VAKIIFFYIYIIVEPTYRKCTVNFLCLCNLPFKSTIVISCCLNAEQYSQSIEDFNTSLEILKTAVEDATTDRRLAETHYHIGVSCVNAQRYDDAVSHFRDAVTILEAKIVALNAVLEAVTPAAESKESSDDAVEDARKELKELEELIPEIKLKVSLLLIFIVI